eukprot:CAMPEP_0184858516 /NCGR_PEP_ID=MMETSP0580-20130426/3602_1 /TAXON_ID=1118495 /ORGANISM="Dactyliosolen fragilissimus" /LENGTH=361 /DNA_ID=CAMNT_0027354687 /DNA_START=176 /DNA_END=1257 /DNA_ORIENTATION=-
MSASGNNNKEIPMWPSSSTTTTIATTTTTTTSRKNQYMIRNNIHQNSHPKMRSRQFLLFSSPIDAAFDFSSKKGWDDYYNSQNHSQENTSLSSTTTKNNNNNNNTTSYYEEYEWHGSIPHSSILEEIPKGSRVLMVGTGNSALPRLLYNAHHGETYITCMDYSKPCIDTLQMSMQHRFRRDGVVLDDIDGGDDNGTESIIYHSNMNFVCADVTQKGWHDNLRQQLQLQFERQPQPQPQQQTQSKPQQSDRKWCYDVILDKGLMDALVCGDGWNAEVDRYMEGVGVMLRTNDAADDNRINISSSSLSQYRKKKKKIILISYKLTSSMKEYLTDIGDSYGIFWHFDLTEKSNHRVSFTIGYGT